MELSNMPIEANPRPCASSIVNVAFDVEIRRATLLLNEPCCVLSVWTCSMLSTLKTELAFIKFWTKENSFENV